MKQSWLRVVIIAVAVPVFLILPMALSMLTMTGKQLIYGFDDFPVGAMVLGFVLGVAVALPTFIIIIRSTWGGMFRTPVFIITIVALIDLSTVPVARWITQRVENSEQYSIHIPASKDSF